MPNPFRAALAASAARPATPKFETALVAAAKVHEVNKSDPVASSATNASSGWQADVWKYYDEVGELHYAANFIAACLQRCVLTVGAPDSEGIIGPVFDEDGEILKQADGTERPELARAKEALAYVRALKGSVGGQDELLKTMGLNMACVGDFHLVGSAPKGGAVSDIKMVDLEWEVLSTDEFKASGSHWVRFSRPGAPGQEIKSEDVIAIRIWRQHPRYSALADSSIRAVLDVLEELVLLTREVRGETLSRLASAGLLLVPSEINYGGEEDEEDGSEEDEFTRDLIATMATAISDKGSAAQTTPLVVRAPAEHLHPDKFRHIDFSPKNSGNSSEKRKEAVQRFAQGVDLPVEIVTGHAGTTFANAVSIDDNTMKIHIEPALQTLCGALTTGYLRVALGDPESPFVVMANTAELVSRPNQAQDAKDLHEVLAISDAALRSATGFPDSAAPDDKEIEERLRRVRAKAPQLSAGTTPALPKPEDKQDGVGSNQPGSDNQQGDEAALAAAVLFATEVTVERAIKRAGARLRSKAAKDQSVRDQLSQVPDVEVAITLGPKLVKQVEPGDLFHGEFDTLHNLVKRRTGDVGYADSLRDACASIAKDRLYQPRLSFPFERVPAWTSKN